MTVKVLVVDDSAFFRRRVTEILEALGFRPAGEVRKFRRAATLNVRGKTVTIALDRVDELGTFVELEIVADPGEVAVARDALDFLATELVNF